MIKERYWAVRIGNPRKHKTCLLVHNDGEPMLFMNLGDATEAMIHILGRQIISKVVRIEIREV